MMVDLTNVMHIKYKTKQDAIHAKMVYDDHISTVSFTNVGELADDVFPCVAVYVMTNNNKTTCVHYYVLIPIDKSYVALSEF